MGSAGNRFPDRPQRAENAAHQSVADEGGLVVLSGRGEVKVLNPVGSRIYSMLDGEHTQAEIVSTIAAEYGVEETKARADFEAFLEELDDDRMLAAASVEEKNA